MTKKIATINIYLQILLVFVATIFLGFLFKNSEGLSENYKTLLTVSSFLFTFYITFLIDSYRTRHNKIFELLRLDMGIYSSLYEMSKVFNLGVQNEVRRLIDEYLIVQIDYYLEDFKFSNKAFRNLFNYVTQIECSDKSQEVAYGHMLRILSDSAKNRAQVETLVGERLLNFEWLMIFSLFGTITFFLFKINIGTLSSLLILAILTTALATLIFIIARFNYLTWKRDMWVWEPLIMHFKSMELLPYFPQNVLSETNLKFLGGEKIRIAKYPNKYPDMRGKNIEIVEF